MSLIEAQRILDREARLLTPLRLPNDANGSHGRSLLHCGALVSTPAYRISIGANPFTKPDNDHRRGMT